MNARRAFHLAATPVVVVGIYAWLVVNAYRDAKHILRCKWEAR